MVADSLRDHRGRPHPHSSSNVDVPIMAFALLLPRAPVVLILGNPSLLMIAAAFVGAAWAWPAVLLLLKPTSRHSR